MTSPIAAATLPAIIVEREMLQVVFATPGRWA